MNWHPWGDEAFDEARRTGRPVFLSVGYSTCHWCHVMEEESFEDLEIARLLNEHFVPIKVDREERPDVDAVYMTAVQALTGHGGWPMSVWLDADRRPFFGGTYFPPHDGDRGAPEGLLLPAPGPRRRSTGATPSAWPGRPRRSPRPSAEPWPGARRGGARPRSGGPRAARPAFYARIHDPQHGGVRGAPKFPSSLPVRLLLRHHRRTGDARSLEMAVHTLERMAAGGIHDQVGGGFHRYSVDECWLVPHFEKMLYDNALLALAYVEAWQVTGRPDFARVVRSTLDYVLREMTAPDGRLLLGHRRRLGGRGGALLRLERGGDPPDPRDGGASASSPSTGSRSGETSRATTSSPCPARTRRSGRRSPVHERCCARSASRAPTRSSTTRSSPPGTVS